MKMMKKVAVILASMVLLGTAAFAKSNFTAISLSIPTNMVTETISQYGTKLGDFKFKYNSIGFGITSIQDSVFSTVDLSFVNKTTATLFNATPSTSTPKDSNATWMFCNALIGFPFNIIDNGTIQFVLAPGFHVSMYSLSFKNYNDERYLGLYLGAGAEAMFNYYLGGFCISAGLGFGYDLWGMDRYGDTVWDLFNYAYWLNYGSYIEGYETKYKNLSIKPRIGVGFNW